MQAAQDSSPMSLTIEGPVASVTLCRAPVNAINEEWVTRLAGILDEIEASREVAVLWIRSNQRAFCAGADLDLMRSRFETKAGREQMVALVRRLQQVYARLEALPAVSVAEIGGAAMGGGMELALACDLRIASETAKMGLPEARLGLLPGAGGTQRLTRLCGDAVARRLILSAEVIDGIGAAALGVAHWAVPPESLESYTRAVVNKISELPRAALGECKSCIEAALLSDVDGFERELSGTYALLGNAETQQRVHEFFRSKQ